MLLSLLLVLLTGACSKPQENTAPAFEIDATSPMKNQVEPTYTDTDAGDSDEAPVGSVEELIEENPTAEEIAETDPMPPAADTTAPITEEASPADETAPASGELVGTKWEMDGIVVDFRDSDTVFLKGGAIAQFAPDGLEADYTLTPNPDGGSTLEANVLGQPVMGIWDGEALTIDGKPVTAQ
jgi:hypothetical protein